jgi:hypothetical protein
MSPPFFIVGNDRSGTTLLRVMLANGPDVAIPPESMYLADFASVRRTGGLDNREVAQRFMERVWAHPKVRLWGLPTQAPVVPSGLSHLEAYRYIVESPFRAYAAAQGKERFADKTPPYLHMIDELLAIWPKAKVVVIVRDGRDVALSVRRLPFGPNNAWAAAQWWARGIREGTRAQHTYPEQVMTVRYEDLVTRPAEWVPRICRFVGIEYDSSMLEVERADRSIIVADRTSWFPNLWTSIYTTSVDNWRWGMTARDRKTFAAVAGADLEILGYPNPEGHGQQPSRMALRIYRWHNEVLRNVNFFRLRVVHERGRELRYAAARKFARARGRGAL